MVEDEKQLLEIARATLDEHGYRVLAAGSPGEALMFSEKFDGEIQLLITDVVMPMMNGRELKECIEQSRPYVKTLFMSGYTTNVISHLGVLDKGMHFIQKPFSPKSLVIKARQVLDAI